MWESDCADVRAGATRKGKNGVVDVVDSAGPRSRVCSLPNDFIQETLVPEHLVHQHLHVVDRVPVEMDVDAAGRGEQLLE
jgi:hypothetical protein